ncbi:MAG: polyhydroxyalkanoic acid system family protein [Lacipirellulaceae bacterium]
MPKFDLSVPNPLGKEQAVARLHGFSEKLRTQYADQLSDFQQSWAGDRSDFSFSAMGFRISGSLTVEEERVRVEGDLPLAATLFRGRITGVIQEQLGKLLGA